MLTVNTVANVSLVLVDQRRHCGDVTYLLIGTKIASANMNMMSPTGDAVMISTTITSLCSLTVKCRFHSLTVQDPYDHQDTWG